MRKLPAVLLLAVTVATAGCGSSSSSRSASRTGSASGPASGSGTAAKPTAGGSVNPNARETLPPGDIPDSIAYVPYTWPGHGLTVSAPEGWSRTNPPGAVVFTDKLNRIRVVELAANGALTPVAARRTQAPALAASTKGFKLQSVSTVSRPAGRMLRIAYLGYSKPDPVTGKFGVLAFERYELAHKGRVLTLILSAPNGSDNVDPWRKVTGSLRFTG